MNKKRFIQILFLVIAGALIYSGCDKNSDSDSNSYSEGYGGDPTDATTNYCLACHEGSYQAFADTTADLYGQDGWLNPHRSAHGTNVSCRTCHEEDETAQQNTRCPDKTVMISTACSDYCHPQYTNADPYPNL